MHSSRFDLVRSPTEMDWATHVQIEGTPVLRAAIDPLQFTWWGGALDLMRMLLEGMTALPSRFEEIYLISPAEPLSRRFRSLFREPKRPAKAFDPALLADMGPGLSRVKFGRFNRKRLAQTLKRRDIDFYLSPDASLGPRFPLPWICYIYDFQHKHYPSFFSAAEIRRRDTNYAKILSDAPALLAESRSVAGDIKEFYPQYANKVSIVPFSPLLRSSWLNYDVGATQSRYQIRNPYFIISNQFWIHKNHSVAFLALAKLLKRLSGADITLVCTGSLEDYRRPDHVTNLRKMLSELGISSHVRLLGHIPKADQIALLRGAKAAIQPTLFEGSPVGGSGYEAIALGVPLMASDIEVNREVEDESHVHFFPPHDADALASLMDSFLKQDLTPSMPDLIGKSHLRRERLCHFLWQEGLKTKQQFRRNLA
jgi:glycosyltransferase involved in cell wall biosynthesis